MHSDLESLLGLLACPGCRMGEMKAGEGELECTGCGRSYPLVQGVPVFHAEGAAVSVVPEGHRSNPIAPAAMELLSREGSLALNIGAGASASKLPGVVEFEYQIFSTTDVAGDAHRLPFRDHVFDVVCAMNVFEHLYAPHLAAREIHRVLKTGGEVLIHTAFLQPLHEPPHHYYNATEFGVRKWFEGFEIGHCGVSDNFLPAYALGMISNAMLYHLEKAMEPGDFGKLRSSTLGDWSDFWNARDGAEGAARARELVDAMLKLDRSVLAQFAAGFELRARKPAADAPRPVSAAGQASAGANDLVNPPNDRTYEQEGVSEHLSGFPAMLGYQERQLPLHLARKVAGRNGAVVELGCYLGGSTHALLEGLAKEGELKHGAGRLIHSYDLFEANDYMVEHTLKHHGVKVGESFAPVFRNLLAHREPFVKVHEGNILEKNWKLGEIRLLYVDILWSWEINQRVFDKFYRHLNPGSWLIHQDFVYSCYPWLPSSMEWLVRNGYFRYVSFAEHSTVAFECLESPASVPEEKDFFQSLPFNERRDLIRSAAERFTGYPKYLLLLSEAYLCGWDGHKDEAAKIIERIEESLADPIVQTHCRMVREGAGIPKG